MDHVKILNIKIQEMIISLRNEVFKFSYQKLLLKLTNFNLDISLDTVVKLCN